MIEYIKGKIAELTPAAAVLEPAAGVAYRLTISLPTYEAVNGSQQAQLYVHEVIREDAWVLYGFATTRERELFRALIGVSGVGAATACIILSALAGDRLATVVAGNDVRTLKSIKGIGAKTAERIIVDLRDKLAPGTGTTSAAVAGAGAAADEALAALTMLGFDRKASEKAVAAIFAQNPQATVEQAVKAALSMIR